MPSVLEKFEKTVERWSNRSIEEIRREPISVTREKVMNRDGKLKLKSHFPYIGRGNVNSKNIISHSDIEKELDRALE